MKSGINYLTREEVLDLAPKPEGVEVELLNYNTMERTNEIRLLQFNVGEGRNGHLYELANDGIGNVTILQQRWVNKETKEYIWVAVQKVVHK